MEKKSKKVMNFSVFVFAIASFITTAYGIHSSLLPNSFLLSLLLSFGIQSLLIVINVQKIRKEYLVMLIPLLIISSGFSYAYYCETIYKSDFNNQAQKILLEKEEEISSMISISIAKNKGKVEENFYNTQSALEEKVERSDNLKSDFRKLEQNDDSQLKKIYGDLRKISENKTIDAKETEKMIKDTENSIKQEKEANKNNINDIRQGYTNDNTDEYANENKRLSNKEKILQEYKNFFSVYKDNSLLKIKDNVNNIIKEINKLDDYSMDNKDDKDNDVIDSKLEEIRNELLKDSVVSNQENYSNLLECYSNFKNAVKDMIVMYDLTYYSESINKKHMDLVSYDFNNQVAVKEWKNQWVKSLTEEKSNLTKLGVIDDSQKAEIKDLINDINKAERLYLYDINYIEKSYYILTYHKYRVLAVAVLFLSLFLDTIGILPKFAKYAFNRFGKSNKKINMEENLEKTMEI